MKLNLKTPTLTLLSRVTCMAFITLSVAACSGAQAKFGAQMHSQINAGKPSAAAEISYPQLHFTGIGINATLPVTIPTTSEVDQMIVSVYSEAGITALATPVNVGTSAAGAQTLMNVTVGAVSLGRGYVNVSISTTRHGQARSSVISIPVTVGEAAQKPSAPANTTTTPEGELIQEHSL